MTLGSFKAHLDPDFLERGLDLPECIIRGKTATHSG